jgi:hypothetical protein
MNAALSERFGLFAEREKYFSLGDHAGIPNKQCIDLTLRCSDSGQAGQVHWALAFPFFSSKRDEASGCQ